ncbi:hypothetical protein K7X08_021489 [Anisodus acutangulus]|uniref:Uncharacterized protein n=1 Tax=Anisodus acutangulus TaxID=402998 RepID=A0A9Q1M6L1_9SOLA|nr:hypothetical protein K7X08_021489 [Anisodus acutangulus]
MQKAVAEAEECKFKKIALEEKVLRLEGDLTAKEVMCSKVSELKNELRQLRRSNSQFLWKIKSLQFEKEDCLKHLSSKGKDENMQKISQLEAELQEIRDRYLNMSQKYAEVEDQREQLVSAESTGDDDLDEQIGMEKLEILLPELSLKEEGNFNRNVAILGRRLPKMRVTVVGEVIKLLSMKLSFMAA